MPDGARKRILNTHATNAITVTAIGGTTIEGQATMTLSAGHEVELELIGTDWRKTGWNEKSLASFVGPVDCSSRVAEYTGDGIPMIPDNVAGTAYKRDNDWVDTDGWTASGGTVSVGNNKLICSSSTIDLNITKSGFSFSGASNRFIYLYLSECPAGNHPGQVYYATSGHGISASYYNTFTIAKKGLYILDMGVLTNGGNDWITSTITSVRIDTGGSPGQTFIISSIYIGTGAYTTPALDRAGNSNNLTLNAVTPVNGKYGKEMSFNGSTSYAQASSPVIGTTGTVAVRFKLNALGSSQIILDNRDGTGYNGILVAMLPSGAINIDLRGISGSVHSITTTQTLTTSTYNTITITYSASQMIVYLNGVAINTSTISIVATSSVTNLQIGKRSTSGYLNGIISHFRYDSRIWTADEARAWSLNPSVEDSIGFSATPSAGKVAVWGSALSQPLISYGDSSTNKIFRAITSTNDGGISYLLISKLDSPGSMETAKGFIGRVLCIRGGLNITNISAMYDVVLRKAYSEIHAYKSGFQGGLGSFNLGYCVFGGSTYLCLQLSGSLCVITLDGWYFGNLDLQCIHKDSVSSYTNLT